MAINHGTRGGYYAHRRLKEDPCDACRAAINEYVREYRAKNGLARNRSREKIRRRALAALRDKYHDEYERLVEQFEADALEDVL
jgi:cytidine deaminase